MSFIKRNWSAAEADEWTKEDGLAILLSPVAYVLIMIGVVYSFLMMWQGFAILGLGIAAALVMHWIIDPKLKALSDEYETRQKEYILELERTVRWEENDG